MRNITQENYLYPLALKILFTEDFKLLPKLIGIEQDEKFIKYRLEQY